MNAYLSSTCFGSSRFELTRFEDGALELLQTIVMGPRRCNAKRYTKLRSSPGRSRKVALGVILGGRDVEVCFSEGLVSRGCGGANISALAQGLITTHQSRPGGDVEE